MRSYGQGCGTAYALDVVGDRWALLIVRDLVFGPKRFSDLRAGLPGIGPNVLSQRLKELEEAGVIQRRVLPPPAGSTVYELTEWGQELEDVVVRLARWGARSPDLPREDETRAEWVVLGLRAIYDPVTRPAPELFELRFGDEVFWARVDEAGAFRVGRGAPEDPDTIIEAEPGPLARLLQGGPSRSGGVKVVKGGRAALQRFTALFRFPPSS